MRRRRRAHRAHRALLAVLLALALVAPALALGQGGAAAAGRGRVLFYGPSTFLGSVEMRVAERLGYEAVLAEPARWRGLTPAHVRRFEAVVFGDRLCERDPAVLDLAVRTRSTWSPVVRPGNHVLIGTDPTYHVLEDGMPAAEVLWENSIRFAAAGAAPGLVATLSCMYAAAPAGTPVPLLAGLGDFRVRGTLGPPFPDCPTTVRVVSPRHPVARSLTSASMSGWTCSPHELFTRYPAQYRAVVTFWGVPFVLARTG